MNDTLKEIINRVGEKNLTNSCSGKDCRVDLDKLPRERVIVDVDLAFETHSRTGKHCDRILFYMSSIQNILVTVLIEHKGRTFDSATDVANQLQGGADFVKEIIRVNTKTTCVPVLFHGSGSHQSQFKKLRRQKILYDKRNFPISKRRCNANQNLASVLQEAKLLS